ncbi:MAG: MFS transporter [Myxococcota bacterium]
MTTPSALGGFWFLYMAGMGMVFSYQSLYLRENVALAGTQLGLVLAVRPLVGMVAQPLWGHLSDRTGARSRVLAGITLCSAVAYAVFPLAQTFPTLVLAMALASLFTTAVMPMNTAVTLAALGPDASHRFGRIRVWGTVGFLASVLALPFVLAGYQDRLGLERRAGGPSEPGLELLFWLAAGFSAAAALLALGRGGTEARSTRAARGDLGRLLRHPPFRRALAYGFLCFLFLQGPIQLFPLLVTDRGGSLETVSRMWIPMIGLEIPLLLYSGAAIARFGPRTLLAAGVIADGLRWSLCALTDDLRVVFALQLLHGVVVVGMIVGLQLYVESVVPERLRSTAQGVLAMVGPSVAGMLSNVSAGALLEHVGVAAPYAVGGACALLLGTLTWWVLPAPSRPAES